MYGDYFSLKAVVIYILLKKIGKRQLKEIQKNRDQDGKNGYLNMKNE